MILLTDEKKKELKNQYKKLYITVLDSDQPIVWRPIKRSEHKEILKETRDLNSESEIMLERQEATCLKCIVFPETEEEIKEILEDNAGTSIVISDEIYRKSGFEIKKPTEEL